MNRNTEPQRPQVQLTAEALENELYRTKYRSRYGRILRSTVSVLIVVAAISALIATLVLPVFQMGEDKMSPTLETGNIIVGVKGAKIARGDIIAFYYNNSLMVKRVVALGGETVEIDGLGNVLVDGEIMDEAYLEKKASGKTNLEYPYTVPENSYFVLNDDREIYNDDSRNSTVGCVSGEEVVAKIIFAVWPLGKLGLIK